jgi:hypothetical protein
MARDHRLKGHSQMFDQVRRVMLNNALALDITSGEARLVVGAIDDREGESVSFRNPVAVAAFGILSQVMEETGAPAVEAVVEPQEPVVIRPKRRLSWITCPACNGEGGKPDLHGNWHECDVYAGAGVARLDQGTT